DDFIQQANALLDRLRVQPMVHTEVASAGFAGGASREVKETDIFLATQTSITFLDVSTDGIGAGDLLGDQATQRKVLAQRSEVLDDAIKQLDRLSVGSKFVNRIHKPALPSTLDTRHSSLVTVITSPTRSHKFSFVDSR